MAAHVHKNAAQGVRRLASGRWAYFCDGRLVSRHDTQDAAERAQWADDPASRQQVEEPEWEPDYEAMHEARLSGGREEYGQYEPWL